MTGLTASSYFDHLKTYLLNGYVTDRGVNDKLEMTEEVELDGGFVEKTVSLAFKGKAIVINLDLPPPGKKKSAQDPLFHFLDNNGRPWSKRCDYIVFQCVGNSLKAYCFEFKSRGINGDGIRDQLKAGAAWCRALHATIKHYTGQSRQISLTKYILTLRDNPEPYLCAENKYLNADHSVRLYKYDDLSGLSLEDLDNNQIELIR